MIMPHETEQSFHLLHRELIQYHNKYPMLRIGQILANFISWCEANDVCNLFYMSDADLIKYFKEFAEL